MSTHEYNPHMLSDDHFLHGEIRYLVTGNECRLLDNRRTPGVIRAIDLKNGYFIWEITDFEDKGKFWEVELEGIANYQFPSKSQSLEKSMILEIESKINQFNKKEVVPVEITSRNITLSNLVTLSKDAETWLKTKSTFLKLNSKIDFQNPLGPSDLQDDLQKYMASQGLLEIEKKTAEAQVLNPYSGDWIRATQITIADLGFKDYSGKAIRSSLVFSGIGSKENRKEYIMRRLAFMRALFELLEISEVELYRAMSTERPWTAAKENRLWTSWTFNYQVAKDFSNLEPGNKFKNSYIVKRSVPVHQVFMTYLETKEMNNQYKEAEAIVIHDASTATI